MLKFPLIEHCKTMVIKVFVRVLILLISSFASQVIHAVRLT